MNSTGLVVLDEFYIKLYKWSLGDTQRELREGFPLLSKLKSAGACAYIDYIKTLPLEQQICLATALVKRTHKQALRLTQEYLTEPEKLQLDHFLSVYMNYVNKYLNEYDLKSFNKNIRPQFLDIKKISGLLADILKPICGDLYHKKTKFEWEHRKAYDNWCVGTVLDVRSSGSQIKYEHIISISTNPTGYQKPFVSLMRWLGITSTEWDLLLPGDEEGAVESVALVCSHFMQALPILLGNQET